MPKVLSLKKSQLSASQKNQKPITQFFKNERSVSSMVSSQPKQAFDNYSEKQAGVEDKIPSKRKASSPVLLDNNGYLHEVNQDKNTKKVKTASKLKSPKKENHEYLKECNLNKKINSISQDEDPSKGREPLENLIDRPPFALILENDGHSNGKVKLSPVKIKSNYVNNITPESNHDDNLHNVYLIHKSSYTTPTKSPVKEKSRSPNNVTKFFTSQEVSPSTCRSTNKALSCTDTEDVGDMFEDEWEINNIGDVMNDIEQVKDFDLRTMQRCEILNIVNHATKTEIRLKNGNHRGTCYIEGVWLETPLCPGDIVGVIASHDASGQFSVGNTSGLLVLRPDYLMSSTSVVAGVFCKRKAVLQERWRGLDSANAAMTIGIIIHELVQKALTRNIADVTQLRLEAERIIKESVQLLYDAGLSEEEVRKNMQLYISPLGDFMNTYFTGKSSGAVMQKGQKDNWKGNINKVLDIEENLCCPQLGLKGRIDATLDVTSHTTKGYSREVVPLELKSGKASMSAEHRGQLVLYGMMLSVQRGEDPTSSQQRGLLLYLKDRVELHDVSCGYPERRDLVILRNQLVQNLAAGPQDVDPEQLVDIEDASSLLQQKLPEPIHRENVCSKCPYLTICSLHLWHTNGPSVSESHPLSKLRDSALGHLSQDHIKYFLRWTTLLKIEEKGQAAASPLHTLWTDTVEKREKRGTCFANLHLKSVEGSGVKFLHIFQKPRRNPERTEGESRGPQEGEFCLVSVDGRPWVAAGVIVSAKDDEIHMALERDLSQRMARTTAFHIDTYESYGTTVQNLTNLGVLLEDTDRSQRLRRLIIDRDVPEFEVKLPREVGRLGTKLMRALNIDQQRAVLRALATKDYALLQGLPGTGKTQTISVLIQMLVRLQRRVLVTAHTHSAVDTVLSRLPDSIRIMRLGAKSRVAECLASRCEQQLAADCETPQQLEQLYDSMEVVGVTCLGATHAMLSKTTFDVCIVDEATQVLQCTVLRPLFAAKRFVLVGDPNQLPPLVKSKAARRLGMDESLFHRLMTDATTSTLHLQYRMNQRLADVANKVAYGGQLRCAGKELAQSTLDIDLKKISHLPPWLATACSPALEQAAALIDLAEGEVTDACRKTCANNTEVCLVIAIVHALHEGGVKHSAIGVVAPYRDQVSLLRRSLAGTIEVSTVDQFQGRDKPVIIYSCTRNDEREETKVKEGEVLNDQRRLAVSVTRAKLKLIVVGNSRALRRYAPLQRLIDACTVTVLQKNDIKHMIQTYGSQVL